MFLTIMILKRHEKRWFCTLWMGWIEPTELKIKEETSATIRCIPFDEETKNLKCILTGAQRSMK